MGRLSITSCEGVRGVGVAPSRDMGIVCKRGTRKGAGLLRDV